MAKKSKILIGLTGNPNTGKSTLFNALTGAKQHVGNWPGKTVEKKEGTFQHENKTIKIVDLPGSYSITAYTKEEKVTTEFINEEKPDAIIQIIDAQNLERNLYITLQLLEFKTPLILAINMADLAKKRGIEIDTKKLSKFLQIPVIKICARKKKGIDKLIKNTINYTNKKTKPHIKVPHIETNNELEKIKHLYGFIHGITTEVLTQKFQLRKQSFTEKVDIILTNRFLGIPIFLAITWLMFQATFTLSGPIMGWIETLFNILGTKTETLLTSVNSPTWVTSLITEGIIGGVGGVLTFVPIIGILFLIMAILEDSGYLTRVAYIMDKIMHRIGLHGKAFIPMILGFGCNVPGIMATRTLETKQDRLLSILINPFMSCGARLPVYALFAGAFFSSYQGLVIFSLYFLGIIIAIIVGLIFKKILSKKLSTPFVIELPPYRWPSIIGLILHVWEKIWIFIKKAGTLILIFSILIWALASFPQGVEYSSQESYAGQIGTLIAPIFEPLGFGNWQTSVALIYGLVAKEVVVGTFGTLYGAESLTTALQNSFTPLSAYAFMAFVLLYIPCIAVIAVVKRETNSWKWPLFMVIYTTSIAWIVAFIIYQGGKLLGFN